MTFNIIRYRGEPNKADFEGVTITRQEKLFVVEWRAFIPCAPYDDHFVFEVPPSRKRIGISEFMCTCGSAAVITVPESERRRTFVCLFHTTYGYHQTSVINKKDFAKQAGEIITPKGKKWLI